MGLFDFLTRKSIKVVQPATAPQNRPECDISKTYVVVELLKIARDQRGPGWYQEFYANVANASFACATPQVLEGPDGFPYFILNSPEPGKAFESFCLQNMKDDFLLDRGCGVVFNPAPDKTADWVFTHGDIVNLHLNGIFVSEMEEAEIKDPAVTKNVGLIKKEEQVLIAQPSETYLPRPTRASLKRFLQSKGIKKPMVMMLTSQSDGKIIRKLGLNIHPENYPVKSELDHLMQQVGWFLPNNYILIPIPKKSSLSKGLSEL